MAFPQVPLTSNFEIPDEISVHHLFALMQQGEEIIILDIREVWEFELSHINKSIHIPLSTLEEGIEELPRDKMIVTICHHGVRSRNAAAILKKYNFKYVSSLNGGVDAWALNIDPTMKRY